MRGESVIGRSGSGADAARDQPGIGDTFAWRPRHPLLLSGEQLIL